MKKKIKISIFADGANLKDIIKLNSNPLIKGFTIHSKMLLCARLTLKTSLRSLVTFRIKSAS